LGVLFLVKPYISWDLAQWLSYLENRVTQEIQLGLTRIKEVAQKLDLCSSNCPVITVAGTNGKGSTVAALERIYHTAGYTVGAYTSPHLLQFNERIRVGLIPVANQDLCDAFSIIEKAREETLLTYFEMTTLAALLHFKNLDLDLLILEVGLGGRLDATNIIDADVSIITTIDFDHQEFLGDTLEAIGYEKAGILRPSKPFIYADFNPPQTLVDVAFELSTPAYFFGKEYTIEDNLDNWSFFYAQHQIKALPKPAIQLTSAAAAIMAVFALENKLSISTEDIRTALSKLFVPGRLQFEKGQINVLYDVSHNPQSARLLASTLRSLGKNTKIHAVFSALKEKDIQGLINPLKDCVDYWYPAQLEVKRAMSATQLLSHFKKAEILAEICYNSPILAFETALSQAKPGDLIVVYGSFFTVSHVMAARPNRRVDETCNG
jgi:dihydrofolate synthase/folylpolyglutamate synthase